MYEATSQTLTLSSRPQQLHDNETNNIYPLDGSDCLTWLFADPGCVSTRHDKQEIQEHGVAQYEWAAPWPEPEPPVYEATSQMPSLLYGSQQLHENQMNTFPIDGSNLITEPFTGSGYASIADHYYQQISQGDILRYDGDRVPAYIDPSSHSSQYRPHLPPTFAPTFPDGHRIEPHISESASQLITLSTSQGCIRMRRTTSSQYTVAIRLPDLSRTQATYLLCMINKRFLEAMVCDTRTTERQFTPKNLT